MKCNQSCILPKIISDLGGRIDISSLGELHKAIALGIPSSRITANGPKNTEFLECCIAEEVCIIIDSLSELEQLLEIGSHLKKTPPILIRLSGFTEHRPSRFGVHKDLWGDCITLLEKSSTQIQYQGISFHIDSHDVESRKQVFWETQEFIRKASQK